MILLVLTLIRDMSYNVVIIKIILLFIKPLINQGLIIGSTFGRDLGCLLLFIKENQIRFH